MTKKQHPDIDVTYLESNNESEYITNIETAIDMESDLIIGVGFQLSSAIEKSALAYPNQQFAIIDGDFETVPENVSCVKFDEEQSGYLVGLIAGKMTKTNKLGFLGGMDIPSVSNFLVGFEKGAKEINPKIEVIHQYANSFTDSAKGKAIANQMFKNNCDIVFTAGGGCNIGVYESARELGKYAIAVDMAQSYIAPDVIITSALKKVDVGVKSTIEEALDGKLKTGVVSNFNLENGGVDYEKTALLPQKVIDIVENKK